MQGKTDEFVLRFKKPMAVALMKGYVYPTAAQPGAGPAPNAPR
jgi:hypothetical protein